MLIETYSSNINSDYVERHPNKLFLYSDNISCKGRIAHMDFRNCDNSLPVPTRKTANIDNRSLFNDNEYEKNVEMINVFMDRIIEHMSNYDCIVIPDNGFGGGPSRMSIRAPMTYEYLCDRINGLRYIN